jgi:hypothetical protein
MDNLYKNSTITEGVRELDKILDEMGRKARRQDTWLCYIRDSSVFREGKQEN